jgi:aldehyde:ferredoxin oxidoreductase
MNVEAQAPYVIDSAYGAPEYESIASLGPCCGVSDYMAMLKAGELCNAYSLDTINTGFCIAFAMECFENGLLTLEDTGGLDLRFGNGDALVQMVERIAHRDGLGDVLADGVARAAEKIGKGSEKYAMHVKNQTFPAHSARYKRGLLWGYATSPTGADHIQGMQDHNLMHIDDDGFLSDGSLRTLGVIEPMDAESMGPEKIRASVYYSSFIGLINSICFCLFVQLFTGMTTDDELEIVRAGTGWDASSFEMIKVGERAYTMARLFNMREGLSAADDKLPERMFGPTTDGALAGSHIDRDEVDKAIHQYYEMMGWDKDTGVPLPWKLHELGLSWAVEHLPK